MDNQVKSLIKKRVIDAWAARVSCETAGRVRPERLQPFEAYELCKSLLKKGIHVDEEKVVADGKTVAIIERSWRPKNRHLECVEKRPVIVWLA
jgi:hypothetical protein